MLLLKPHKAEPNHENYNPNLFMSTNPITQQHKYHGAQATPEIGCVSYQKPATNYKLQIKYSIQSKVKLGVEIRLGLALWIELGLELGFEFGVLHWNPVASVMQRTPRTS